MKRHRSGKNPSLARRSASELFPNIEIRGSRRRWRVAEQLFHIAVCMLEWQAMEDLVAPARRAQSDRMEAGRPLQGDYSTLLNHREQVESVLNTHGVKW